MTTNMLARQLWISPEHLTACPMGFFWLNYTYMGHHQKHVYLYHTISRIDCKELKLWAQSVTEPKQIEVFHKDWYSGHCFSISLYINDLLFLPLDGYVVNYADDNHLCNDNDNVHVLQKCLTSGNRFRHYSDVIMGTMASEITSVTIVYSTVNSSADQRKKSKLRATGLCAGNSPGTGEFPAQMASNAAEDVSI